MAVAFLYICLLIVADGVPNADEQRRSKLGSNGHFEQLYVLNKYLKAISHKSRHGLSPVHCRLDMKECRLVM